MRTAVDERAFRVRTEALDLIGVEALDAAAIDRTLGSVLKYGDDQEVIRAAGLELLVRSGD